MEFQGKGPVNMFDLRQENLKYSMYIVLHANSGANSIHLHRAMFGTMCLELISNASAKLNSPRKHAVALTQVRFPQPDPPILF